MIWNPTSFHIELTNVCNAKCPFCIRTEKGIEKVSELSYEDISSFFTPRLLKNTKNVILCGTWGDPIYAKDFLKIVGFLKENNIGVSISTNGYNLKKNFWNQLGTMGVKVVFGIDGITQEIHSQHRVGTKLSLILKNAREFIIAGGEASWQFIVFKNNEHQIKKAQELANTLGFRYFQLRKSRSYSEKLQEPVGNIIYNQKLLKISRDFSCIYKDINRLYISSRGYILPCCYLGNIEESNTLLQNEKMNIRNASFEEIQKYALWEKGVGSFTHEGKNICHSHCSQNGRKRN